MAEEQANELGKTVRIIIPIGPFMSTPLPHVNANSSKEKDVTYIRNGIIWGGLTFTTITSPSIFATNFDPLRFVQVSS